MKCFLFIYPVSHCKNIDPLVKYSQVIRKKEESKRVLTSSTFHSYKLLCLRQLCDTCDVFCVQGFLSSRYISVN